MLFLALLKIAIFVTDYVHADDYKEQFRAQVHFSPPKGWMNDPNGLVFYDGEYHLFFQYNKDESVPANISWGHAVSKDLIRWEYLGLAIESNVDGQAFSGSAVVDKFNASSLQESEDKSVIIAILTRDLDRKNETQHVYFSNDRGRTFTPYKSNPVLLDHDSPVDFRDPKVRKIHNNFVLSLAVNKEIRFYKSGDLLKWEFLSSFGSNPKHGNHDGVWECPDLIPFPGTDPERYVLLVSVNPGGPVVGSATQYFVGKFNGTHFINENPPDKVMWLDYGPDNYAGITYDNTPGPDPVFIAWASNWDYGHLTPQDPWRGQMSLPRTLHLEEVNGSYRLRSHPEKYLSSLFGKKLVDFNGQASAVHLILTEKVYMAEIELDLSLKPQTVEIILKNSRHESFSITWFDNNTIVIDRSKSGQILNPSFAKRIVGTRVSQDSKMTVDIIYDSPVIEIFFDRGLTSFTVLHFPSKPYPLMEVNSIQGVVKKNLIRSLKSIWESKKSS